MDSYNAFLTASQDAQWSDPQYPTYQSSELLMAAPYGATGATNNDFLHTSVLYHQDAEQSALSEDQSGYNAYHSAADSNSCAQDDVLDADTLLWAFDGSCYDASTFDAMLHDGTNLSQLFSDASPHQWQPAATPQISCDSTGGYYPSPSIPLADFSAFFDIPTGSPSCSSAPSSSCSSPALPFAFSTSPSRGSSASPLPPSSASSPTSRAASPSSRPASPSARSDRRRLPCPVPSCTRMLTSAYTLRVHVAAHAPKPRAAHPCTRGCGESFSRAHDRLRHEVAKHGRVCEWRCNECSRFFSSRRTLGHHRCPVAGGMRWVDSD